MNNVSEVVTFENETDGNNVVELPRRVGRPKGSSRVAKTDEGTVTHKFRVRKDLEVCVKLPQDFTAEDASRLSRMINALV